MVSLRKAYEESVQANDEKSNIRIRPQALRIVKSLFCVKSAPS